MVGQNGLGHCFVCSLPDFEILLWKQVRNLKTIWVLPTLVTEPRWACRGLTAGWPKQI